MSAISFSKFGGMVPRSPDQLLPDNAAAHAANCDFSKDVLGALKGGLSVFTANGNPAAVKGMYTLDGAYWYTWDFETTAYQSPVIGEVYNRVYYVESNTLYVTISPESSAYKANYIISGGNGGGSPNANEKWIAGVPNPTVAPTLTLVDRSDLADYPNAAFTFRVWWTDGTGNYGATTQATTTVSAFKTYTFTAPSPPSGTPDGATLVVEATLAVPASGGNAAKTIFTLNSSTNASVPVRSSALPGGVEMLVSLTSTTYTVSFSWGVVETRAYVYTMQNTWDEESGPSPAALISPTYMQDVKIATTSPSFTNYRPYKQTNIYRTYGSNTYIKTTVSGASTPYTDSSHTVTSIGVGLTSMEWVPCPTGIGVNSLVVAPNGWFACYKGNTLYMSEPYRPHTWPYSMTFPKNITGICVGPQGLVVTTYSACYLVLGPHPAAVNQQELPVPIGGISQRGMTKYETGVVFLSNDGIVLVDGSQATLDVSQKFFTRETWRSLYGNNLSDMALAYHDGFLVCVSTATSLGFLVRLDEVAGAFTKYNNQFGCMMRLSTSDAFYYSVGKVVYQFREGTALGAEWYSKQFILPQNTKYGIGFARMTGTGTITVTPYAEGAAIKLADNTTDYSVSLNPADSTKYFRLPPHRGSFKWQFRVTTSGACTLDVLAFAHTMDELKNV